MRSLLALLLFSGLLAGMAGAAPGASPPRILVFSKTTGYRHASIPAALHAVQQLGAQNGFAVDETEDAAAFTDANLQRYDAVAFILTSGEVFADPQRAALQRYIRGGGGFVGVHSATDTERGWPWYGQLIGAWSSGHPDIQPAALDVVLPRDPSTEPLPARWTRTDEWYNWIQKPTGVRVLLTIDESTYSPGDGAMGAGHPIAWSHEFEGGRAWYTQGGHTEESYSEPLFLAHLLGGIRWAAGLTSPPTPVPAVTTPAKKAPKIVSLKTSAQGRRIVVTVRHANCGRCSGQLKVHSKTIKLRVGTTMATGLSPALPAGRWQVTVVMRSASSGLSATTRRWVRIG